MQASAEKTPPLLEVVAAIAASPSLAPLLGNCASQVAASEDATCPVDICREAWASQHHLGSRCGPGVLTFLLPLYHIFVVIK